MHLSTVDFVSSESGPWVFNSKPSVMSLSLNNKSMSFEGEGVTISFEHQNNSMVGIPPLIKKKTFCCVQCPVAGVRGVRASLCVLGFFFATLE